MAANFSFVPAALLEMRNKYGPIVVQAPSAGVILVAITAMMVFFAF